MNVKAIEEAADRACDLVVPWLEELIDEQAAKAADRALYGELIDNDDEGFEEIWDKAYLIARYNIEHRVFKDMKREAENTTVNLLKKEG